MIRRRRKFFYDTFTFDEFMQWQEDMYWIGFSVSAWMGDYGKATCLNCRAIISISTPGRHGIEYAKKHREHCHLGAGATT